MGQPACQKDFNSTPHKIQKHGIENANLTTLTNIKRQQIQNAKIEKRNNRERNKNFGVLHCGVSQLTDI